MQGQVALVLPASQQDYSVLQGQDVRGLPEISEPLEMLTECWSPAAGLGISGLLESSQNSVLCHSYPQQTAEKSRFGVLC